MIESPTLNTWERVGRTMVLFCPRRHLMETVPVKVFETTSEASHLFAQSLNCPGCQRPSRYGAVVGCKGCESNEERGFGPAHYASVNCESGGLDHCTCDTCF